MLKQAVGALLLVSGTAIAADDAPILFNDVGVRYISSDADGTSGDGYGLDLRFSLLEYVFFTADYNTRSFDESDGTNSLDVDVEFFSGGFGANYAINDAKTMQVFGTLTWEQLEFDLSGTVDDGNGGGGGGGGDGTSCDFTGTPLDIVLGGLGGALGFCDPNAKTSAKALQSVSANSREDGYGASVGIRAFVMDNLETNFEYKYRDYDEDNESVIAVGVGYYLGNWMINAGYEMYDELDIDEWTLGASYTFGKDEGGSSIW